MIENTPAPYQMREPCKFCGDPWGTITRTNGQNVVRCGTCGRALYNAPRTETGERQRSVTTVRNGIPPKLRAQVIIRANRRCELCGAPAAGTEGLMVDHMLSVADGVQLGLTEAHLNNIANLAALCPECNLGKGRAALPVYLMVAILQARTVTDADE